VEHQAADDAGPVDGAVPTDGLPRPRGRWRRGEEPEFGRLAFFTDAVFAIALTLLVLDIRLPELADGDDPGEMLEALADLAPQFISFVAAFAVLAGYWAANHRFFGRLRAIDAGLVGRTLVYLAMVAFLPFPTTLIGEHEANPVSGLVFAVALAAVSGMEAVLFAHARHADLFRVRMPVAEYRWELVAALQPCVLFMATAPLSFIHPTVMLLSWLVLSPVLGVLINRLRPPAAPAPT
jgi:uncharacterized membrane protein